MTAGEPMRVRLTRLEDGAVWEGDVIPRRSRPFAPVGEVHHHTNPPPLVIDGREASDHGTDDTDGTLADQCTP